MDMLKVWLLVNVTIDIIGQSIIVHAQNIHCVLFKTITFTLSLQLILHLVCVHHIVRGASLRQ